MNTVTAKKSEGSEQKAKDAKDAEERRLKEEAYIDAKLAEGKESYRLHGGKPMDEVFDRIINELKQKHGL